MKFSTSLIPARLVRRYKRFLADAILDTGEQITAHCANPGSMLGLKEEGQRIWLEPNDDPRKKLKYGWRLVEHEDGHMTCVDTAMANRVVKEALEQRRIKELTFEHMRPEVPYGENSRVDFLLTGQQGALTYLEVKSVTLCRQEGRAEFPDSVTQRGEKHLRELAKVAQGGHGAVMLFLVQRTDCDEVSVARDIDPNYADALSMAHHSGVQILAYNCSIEPNTGVRLQQHIPFIL